MTDEPAWKDNEIRGCHSSMGCGHKDDKASLASSQIVSFGHQPHSTPASKEVWKKGGRMFSILLAVHLALLACTLVSSGAFEKIAVHDYDVFFLLTVMMLVVIIWIIFYLVSTSRCPDAIPCRDSHAGPIWLRGRSSWGRRAGALSTSTQCPSACPTVAPVAPWPQVLLLARKPPTLPTSCGPSLPPRR